MKYLKAFLVFIIFAGALLSRMDYLKQQGKDDFTYKRAVDELLSGQNPYKWTIRSYTYGKDPWNHGFAYLPALLYVYAPFYLIADVIGSEYFSLWKIPIIVADLLIGWHLYKLLSNKNFYFGVVAAFLWLFNPYLIITNNYTYADPLAILFMMLALKYLEEDDVLAGTFYGISIAFKTFPVLLFPIMLLKSKDKKRFLLAGFLIAVLISIPFMRSLEFFRTYIVGSLLVHGDRAMQGRPFLWYLSYLTKIELIRIIPIRIYTFIATFSGWALSSYVLLNKKFKKSIWNDKYVLSVISFTLFYIFTPILNRTYLLWFMPVLFIGLSKVKFKDPFYYVFALVLFFAFYSWYLSQWIDGFHITPLI